MLFSAFFSFFFVAKSCALLEVSTVHMFCEAGTHSTNTLHYKRLFRGIIAVLYSEDRQVSRLITGASVLPLSSLYAEQKQVNQYLEK